MIMTAAQLCMQYNSARATGGRTLAAGSLAMKGCLPQKAHDTCTNCLQMHEHDLVMVTPLELSYMSLQTLP